MVKAQVLDVDVEKERISLGIKQLGTDPLANTGEVKKGGVVTCTVTAVTEAGLEVLVGDEGAKGFIRKADLARDRGDQRAERFNVGDKLDAKITQIDRATRKLSLSVKAREIAEEKEAVATYGSSDSGASLGDILGAAMSRAKAESENKK
jgi:small subunit ribosomal protein S1